MMDSTPSHFFPGQDPSKIRVKPRDLHSPFSQRTTHYKISLVQQRRGRDCYVLRGQDLLEKNKINPRSIDILITNSSVYSPTPSLCAMVIKEFRMRSNILSFNLSGMGCTASLVSIGLAKDLLKVHRNSLALIVSSESLSQNCKEQDKKIAKYQLQHVIRISRAQDDQSYACIFQDEDREEKTGISISKSILNVAGEALKANMASLGPLVLPFSEQFRYGLSRKSCASRNPKGLKLTEEEMEASKMTLHRVWQIGLGGGFKSNSAVWKCLHTIEPEKGNAWSDRIDSYPVDIPDIVEID
ncbi:hypothetical protein C3L33_14860, partial [Rhododendron williamsianum]